MFGDFQKHTFTFVGVVILAALAASLGFYVFSYKSTRENYFIKSGRRQLGIVAEQIEGAIDNRRSALRNAALDGSEATARTDVCRVASTAAPTAHATNGENANKTDPRLKRAQSQLGLAGLINVACVPPAKKKGETSPEPEPLPELRIEPLAGVIQRESSSLDFSSSSVFDGVTPLRDARLTFCFHEKEQGKVNFVCDQDALCGSTTLSKLLLPFLKGDGFGEGNLFVTQGQKVLFASGGDDLRVGAVLGAVPAAETKSSDKAKSDSKADAKPAATPPPAPVILPSIVEMQSVSLVRDVDIAGTSYKLFTQPLHLLSGDTDGSIGFLLDSRVFYSDVARLSYGSLSFVPLLIGIALLGAKLLKLRTMGSRERLTAADVRMLVFSILALSGIITTLGLALYESHRLGRALDAELVRVADEINRNVTAELTAARGALQAFVRDYAKGCPSLWDESDVRWDQLAPVTGIFDRCAPAGGGFHCQPDEIAEATPFGRAVSALRSGYPFFDMIIRSDSAGLQLEKWGTRAAATPLFRSEAISVDDVRVGRLLEGQPPVTIQTRLSENTGTLIPVLSTPITSPGGDFAGSAVLLPEMASLLKPVLPAGIGFAVLERNGTVVAHSTLSRSLYENFFEECTAAGSVRSLIESRGIGTFEGSYRGRAQEFYASPMPGSPWTLVVFRDLEVPRTLSLDALLTWLAVYGAYLGIALLGVTLLRFLFVHQGAKWIWPDRGAAASYATGLLALMVTILVFLAAIVHRPLASLAMLGASIALPMATTAHAYLRLGWSNGREPHHPAIAASLFFIAMVVGVATSRGDHAALAISLGGIAVLVLLARKGAETFGTYALPWLLLSVPAVAVSIWSAHELRFVAGGLAVLIAVGALSFGVSLVRAEQQAGAASQLPMPEVGQSVEDGRDADALADEHPRPTPPPTKRTYADPWFKEMYAVAGVAIVVIIGVLPAAAFFEDVWDQSLEVFVRHGQLKTAEALDRRDLRIAEDYRNRALVAETGSPAVGEAIRGALKELHDERQQQTWDVVSSKFFGKLGSAGNPPAGAAPQPESLADREARIAERHFSGLISSRLLVYHDESIEMREMLDTRAADARWEWSEREVAGVTNDDVVGSAKREPSNAKQIELQWTRHNLGGGTTRATIGATWPPPGLEQGSPPLFVALVIVLAVLLGGWYFLIRWVMSCVFGVGEWRIVVPPTRGEPHFGNGILLLRRAGVSENWRKKEALGVNWDRDVHIVDLRSEPTGGQDVRDTIPADAKVVLVKHLEERLEDLPSLEGTLKLLESLLFRQKRTRGEEYLLVVVSAVKPLAYLRRRLNSNADAEADRYVSPQVIGRWARFVESLDRVDADYASPAEKGASYADKVESFSLIELVAWFLAVRAADLYSAYRDAKVDFGSYASETSQTPRLRGIAWEIFWQKQVGEWRTARIEPPAIRALLLDGRLAKVHPQPNLDEDEGKARTMLMDATRAHYRALWSQLTDDEQLTLVQLAKEGYVNPRGWRLVNELMARGLVIFTPAPRLMNESFRQFVASEETDLQVKRWEAADGRSGWDKTRSIILLLIIAGGLVVYTTQPERFGSIAAAIGALGTAAVTVANMFGLFGGPRAPAAPPTKP